MLRSAQDWQSNQYSLQGTTFLFLDLPVNWFVHRTGTFVTCESKDEIAPGSTDRSRAWSQVGGTSMATGSCEALSPPPLEDTRLLLSWKEQAMR
jgi:hypothetical protein